MVKYASSRPITNAMVWFITETLSYNPPGFTACGVTWQRTNGNLNTRARTVTATLPAETKAYYVNLMDDRGLTAPQISLM